MMIAKCVAVTGPQDFPFGTLGGNWRFTVSSADPALQSQTVDSATPDASFQLAPGDYTCTAQRLGSDNAPLGPSASQKFTVASPATVSIDVAQGLSVTLSAG